MYKSILLEHGHCFIPKVLDKPSTWGNSVMCMCSCGWIDFMSSPDHTTVNCHSDINAAKKDWLEKHMNHVSA